MRAELEYYSHLDSPLHRWDARWKIFTLAIFMFAAAIVSHPLSAVLFLFFGLALLSMGKLPWILISKRLGALQIFLIPCFLILPFTVPGTPLSWSKGWLTYEGSILATLLYLRAVSILVVSMALVYSTPMDQLMHAAEKLKVPRFLVRITLLTYRYIFNLAWELSSVRWALITRGFQNRTALWAYQTWANIVGIILLRGYERTERIYRAMLCRGYDGSMRTFHSFSTRPFDVITTLSCMVGIGILLGLDTQL